MLKYALLGFLTYTPMTGYDLKHQFAVVAASFWHAEVSQIYLTLKKLEAEGLVTSQIQPQDDHPDRRLYTITDRGRHDLRAWLNEPITELPPIKQPVLLKLFFAAPLEQAELLTQLRLLRNLHLQKVSYYRGPVLAHIRGVVKRHPHLEKDARLWEATRRFGELSHETYLRWLDETIAMVEEQW
jgi:DNA-binding PadR family transcriptional regulator